MTVGENNDAMRRFVRFAVGFARLCRTTAYCDEKKGDEGRGTTR